MNRRQIFLALVISGLLATLITFTRVPSTSAQSDKAPEWLSVTIVHIKPDMLTEAMNLIKTETIPALQKGGVKWFHTWETAVFGEGYEYSFITPIENLAQYDGESPVLKALGKDGAAAYTAKVRRLINSTRSYAIQFRPDLSYEPETAGPPKLAVVSSVHVMAGHNQEFENLIKTDALPAVKKSGVSGYWVHRIMFGGDANEYVIVVPSDSFADIGKGHPFVRALGEAGANKIFQKTAGIIAHTERTIVRYNPELSFSPPPAK